MERTDTHIISVSSDMASITINRMGGAITDFHLIGSGVNPLNFELKQEGSPDKDFFFRGHFLCLGRWGDPSPREYLQGIPKHGHFSRMIWDATVRDISIEMHASSELEGLSVERTVMPGQRSPCFQVTEKVTNIQPLGRLYNMVQHPTLASPFLNERTIIDCSAGMGFDYASEEYISKNFSCWPAGRTVKGSVIDLRCPQEQYSSVFSFVSDQAKEWGWITAFSPDHLLLFGYLWRRRVYPWINLWIHWDDGRLQFQGLEFGTTGVHKPFGEILDKGLTNLLGEKTYRYIEPGESQAYSYIAFEQKVNPGFSGIEDVRITEDELIITEKHNRSITSLTHNFNLSYGI